MQQQQQQHHHHHHHRQPELFWPRVVMRKWFNISAEYSDYSADTDDDDNDHDFDSDPETSEFCQRPRESRLKNEKSHEAPLDPNDVLPRSRRRKSETFRAQYINQKELRICVGTWNVGGKLPPDDLDIENWLDSYEPADIYVIGFQEIIPLNAGNIFGAEDSRPVPKWEEMIRETLNKIQPAKTKFKCYSEPPSPSRFKPSEDVPDIEDEIVQESDSDCAEEIYPLNEGSSDFDEVSDRSVPGKNVAINAGSAVLRNDAKLGVSVEQELQRQFSSPKKLNRLNGFHKEDQDSIEREEASVAQYITKLSKTLTKTLSGTERIGLSWPEPPLDLLGQRVLERPNSFRSIKSFMASKSFKAYNSFKSNTNGNNRWQSEAALLAELNLESLMRSKRRPPFVRIVSKQMVGIFLTIWVRRSLRKHIQNLNVSTIGVGLMGYIGNKGSISVSMSIYQTLFCFICTHLTSGEKDADAIKRNVDVREIHRRTHFKSLSGIGLPKSIYDHERIIWLGDLNYRINLSYEKTCELISKKDWSKLVESDQLVRELKKGHAFDGWSEGALNFPPTYKYELNSERYHGEDPKLGRRTPAWCDRILSFGKGMRLVSYKRSELRLSDHRPVTASYVVEVEVFSARKLQKALTFTDAEIGDDGAVANLGIKDGISHLTLGEDVASWER